MDLQINQMCILSTKSADSNRNNMMKLQIPGEKGMCGPYSSTFQEPRTFSDIGGTQ